MVCKGICIRHKTMKPVATGRYSIGQKRCQVCEIFLKCDGYRLRTSPRNSKFEAELRATKEIDKAKISVVYKQPPIQVHQKHKTFLDYDSKMCITCKRKYETPVS